MIDVRGSFGPLLDTVRRIRRGWLPALVAGLLAILTLTLHTGSQAWAFDVAGSETMLQADIGDEGEPAARRASAPCSIDAAFLPRGPSISFAQKDNHPLVAANDTLLRSAPTQWEKPPLLSIRR